jgi:hypothetical protein
VPVTPALRSGNPVEAAAVDFAARAGIPVDAATATGSRGVRSVQAVSDRSLGGAVVAERAAAAQEAGLQREGAVLASRAAPTAVVPEQAGEALQATLTRRVQDFHAEATKNYDAFRAIESQPQNIKRVQTGPLVDRAPIDRGRCRCP